MSKEIYQVVNLFDWTGGIRDNRQNPLAFPHQALMSGENTDLVDMGLKTRRGVAFHTGPDPIIPGASGVHVRFLKQVRFPTYQTSYLLAQAECSGISHLCVSTDSLPVSGSGATWQTISTLGSGAGVVSVATLNDRAVITEGNAKPPLVFAGCLDSSGTDWAVPKAALVTFDSGRTFHDATPQLCDKDPETYTDIPNLPVNSGWMLVCTDMPQVSGLLVDMESTSGYEAGLTVEGYSGVWSSGNGWSTTVLSGTSIRILTHSGSTFSGEYQVLNHVPGYWYRIKFPVETAPDTIVKRALFQAPIQPLQVIGEGSPDTPLGFIFWDHSERSARDWTVEVADNTWPTVARLNNDPLNTGESGKEGWQSGAFASGWDPSGDRLYVGYLTRFNAVEIQPHNDYRNSVSGTTLAAEYWNGKTWTDLTVTDGTQEPSGTTFAVKGNLSWVTPTGWRQCRPIGQGYPQGYWIRLRVNKALSLKTWVSEARIWPVLDPLKKHRLAITVRDRIVLLNRPDAPDQIDISRALEEYGFAGSDSSSIRIGGQDDIVAAVEAFNQGFVAKTEDWFILNGYNPQTFSFERAEAANQVPINNRVVVRAPLTEADQKNLMGLYYLNRFGAWYFAGLKVYHLSEDVTWFDAAADLPRIDLDSLHLAYGVYWPERNWIIWSVPMIVESGQSSQPTNNRLIVYDLRLRTWLPPFTLSLASLATAYHRNSDAPGKTGQIGLYGGDYQGRIIRLFGPQQTTDLGAPISGWVETGWLHFGSPEYGKLLRLLTLYGKTSGSHMDVTIYADGDGSSGTTLTYSGLSDLGNRLFAQEQKPDNMQGRFFKFRIEFSDTTEIYGLQIGASVIRQWGAL
ncbi:MAG: hypothetical protein AB1646_17605 [Thermodesulfobacteriota bacterium]